MDVTQWQQSASDDTRSDGSAGGDTAPASQWSDVALGSPIWQFVPHGITEGTTEGFGTWRASGHDAARAGDDTSPHRRGLQRPLPRPEELRQLRAMDRRDTRRQDAHGLRGPERDAWESYGRRQVPTPDCCSDPFLSVILLELALVDGNGVPIHSTVDRDTLDCALSLLSLARGGTR